jgi:ATP-dependent RNA helicase DDX1
VGLWGFGAAGTGSADEGGSRSCNDRGAAIAITPDGLKTQSRHQKEWHGCRTTKGVSGHGRYYYEAIVTDEGLCRVGFSTEEAKLDLGTCEYGYGYGGTGKKSNKRQFDDYGGPFGKGDVIGCYLDLENMEISYAKNGTDLGLAFAINRNHYSNAFFPAVVLKNAEMQFNFGDQEWKNEPEPGFVGFTAAADKEIVKNRKKGTDVQQRKIVNNAPQALIIEPSRELAEQTCKQLQLFKAQLGAPIVKDLLVVGGAAARDQIAALKSGVDIVVATPGRLEDLISTGELALNQCRFFILDEADGLLKAGYDQLITRIHGQIPKMTSDGTRLQMIVCSATLHAFEVKKMAEKLMHFPTWIDLKGQDSVPETVHHVVVMCDPKADAEWSRVQRSVQTDGVHQMDRVGPGENSPDAWSEAIKIMKVHYCLKAIQKMNMDYGIIFCRTKLDCDNLERYLKQMGGNSRNSPYSCVCLHGDRKPHERKANLEMFKKQEVRFLICTDVAARGLDVKNVPFVINVTLPDDKANYVHRIGRVGRAERMGLAISLVAAYQEKVENYSNI